MENPKPILMILERERGENIDVSLLYGKGKETEIEDALLHTAREAHTRVQSKVLHNGYLAKTKEEGLLTL